MGGPTSLFSFPACLDARFSAAQNSLDQYTQLSYTPETPVTPHHFHQKYASAMQAADKPMNPAIE
jgi:hypothetical protein